MSGAERLTTAEETKIVMLLARGDTYPQIQEEMKPIRHVNEVTIGRVKKRNQENLELIRERLLKREEEDALSIKRKANKLIANKLDRAETEDEKADKIREDHRNGKIDKAEYDRRMRTTQHTSLPELVTVSREMHSQSQTQPPAETPQKDLEALIQAINSRDQVEIVKTIFKAQDDISEKPEAAPSPGT